MKKISAPILEISNLCHKEKNKVIDRLNISVPKGDCFVVLHKSPDNIELLTDILKGRSKVKKGKIFFKGDNVTGMKNVYGVVEKKHDIPKLKTVFEYSGTPIVKRGLSRSMTGVLVRKEAQTFSLSEFGDTPCGKLPLETAFRVELFSAYMCSHELIVMNEPFFGLDEEERREGLKWLKEKMDKFGFSLLVFTEDVETALYLGNSVMAVDDKTESIGIISIDENKIEKSRLKVLELYDRI